MRDMQYKIIIIIMAIIIVIKIIIKNEKIQIQILLHPSRVLPIKLNYH